jgi:hypothetical protein
MRSASAEAPLQDSVSKLWIHARLLRSLDRFTVRLLFPVLAFEMALVVSCGGATAQPTAPPSTTLPLLSAHEVIGRSRASMAALRSFSFDLTHKKGATLLPGGFEIHESDGIVSAPDRVSLTAKATFSGLFVNIDAVIFPEITYMTNPLTGNWNQLRGDESPFSVFDPPGLISDILSEITTVQFADDGDSNQSPIRLEGELPAFAMRNLVGGTDPDKTLNYTMQIDSDFRLLSVELTGVIRAGEETGVQRTIALDDFDVPVNIESPI